MIYSKFCQNISPTFTGYKSARSIVLAVSGGSDSMALCMLFNRFFKEHGGTLHCVTINHQLRQESGEEANKVNQILRGYGINHLVIPWLGEKPKSNIQENARIARYKLLTDYCIKNNIEFLATGHQKNDQAENFIMRAERGSGIYGLSGIPEISVINNVTVLRPLLDFSKQDLQNFLRTENIEWIEDPSNSNEKFTRIRVRKLLSEHPDWVDKFNLTTKNLSRSKECIDYLLENSMKELVIYPASDYLYFNLIKFNKLPQEIRFRMLSKLLQNFSKKDKPARGERIENLIYKIEKGKEFKASTLSGCIILRKKDNIIISQENTKL